MNVYGGGTLQPDSQIRFKASARVKDVFKGEDSLLAAPAEKRKRI